MLSWMSLLRRKFCVPKKNQVLSIGWTENGVQSVSAEGLG